MRLNLRRKIASPKAVIGQLEVDGSFECYTLEDPDGAGDRIATGDYRVIIDFSNRFQKQMPHVLGTPAIDTRGIRIHCGNTQADTEGCILLGQSAGEDEIEGSRAAFNAFLPKLEAALARGEAVTLTVTDETQPNPALLPGTALPQPAPHLDIPQSQGFGSLQTVLSFLKL